MEERKLGVQLMVLPAGTTAKQALEMVYRGEIVLSPQQMRAAIECLQFENPKVSAVAVTHMDGQDFASSLERAIEHTSKDLPVHMRNRDRTHFRVLKLQTLYRRSHLLGREDDFAPIHHFQRLLRCRTGRQHHQLHT